MNKISLFLLLMILSITHVFSQVDSKRLNAIQAAPVVYYGDTLYHQAKVYCVMKEIKGGDPNHPDYKLSNLKGEQLIYIRYEIPTGIGSFGSYRVKFNSGNEVKLKTKEEKELPGIIVSNELIADAMMVPKDKEEAFVLNNGGALVTGSPLDDKFKMVTRNRKAMVIVIEDAINQDTNKIGYFNESGTYINKIFSKQVVFYLPNGQKIAEAVYADADASSATIMTMKDGKSTTINLIPSKNSRKQVIDYLIDNNYL